MGSIGVVRASFGLKDAIAKLGIERRVQTAGAVKSQLDPFKPQDLADLARSKDILEGVRAFPPAATHFTVWLDALT